jgi:hypothetical protein
MEGIICTNLLNSGTLGRCAVLSLCSFINSGSLTSKGLAEFKRTLALSPFRWLVLNCVACWCGHAFAEAAGKKQAVLKPAQ